MRANLIISLIPLLLILVLFIVPFWRILPRAGIASPWALTVIFYPMVLVWLWVLAFKKWPADKYDIAEAFK